MIAVPTGEYRYQVMRANELIAVEEESLGPGTLCGVRRWVPAANTHEVEARLDAEGFVMRINVRYRRGPFARTADYETGKDMLSGSVSALAGRNEIVAKLGRFREIDGDLMLFKALIIAHIRARGQSSWTGRVTVIDPNTLVAASHKQSYRQSDACGRLWRFEPRMGEAEEIELDGEGRVVRRRDATGLETILVGAKTG